MKKRILLITLLISSISFSQNLLSGQKRWSSVDKLTVDDYKIKISDSSNDAIYTQLVISHEAKGFDFFKRNLNQRVSSIFLRNASWIDTTKIKDIHKHIDFQQIQFDLSEIYTRKFRKRLLKNKNKIANGFNVLNQISNEIMAEFSNERLLLAKETRRGLNDKKIAEWKEKIALELNNLNEFRYENKKKIKLTK
ncbi:hypothetical protein [Tenacibaculum adriaticum]|nr:hypothetical protein [Tenacibaculum adriaticum]